MLFPLVHPLVCSCQCCLMSFKLFQIHCILPSLFSPPADKMQKQYDSHITQSYHTFTTPFPLESAKLLHNPTVAYKTWGKLNERKSNVILICHALTGSSDVQDWYSLFIHLYDIPILGGVHCWVNQNHSTLQSSL